MKSFNSALSLIALISISFGSVVDDAAAQAVVPGSGTLIDFVGDTFEKEGESWEYYKNSPKASRENDEQLRFPRGYSANLRWFEGPERGQPDFAKVVPTPEGALPNSNFALLARTLNSGIPGYSNNKVEQDDLIVDIASRVGMIPVHEQPNAVARIYLPPPEQWENRTGPHFGFRTTANTHIMKMEELPPVTRGRRFRRQPQPQMYRAVEQYWPGIWIHFRSETDPANETDSAFLTVRGNNLGHDFIVKEIPVEDFGWWTFGMSYTPDGQVHFYAKKGVENLAAEDHLASKFPYTYRAEKFETMFFNFCNNNDGRTWSTPFLIDDPQLFVLNSARIQSIVASKKPYEAARTANLQQRAATASE